MTMPKPREMVRAITISTVLLSLTACDGVRIPTFGLGGDAPRAQPTQVKRPAPDARGVITYATYQVAVVGAGDTLQSVASRVGTDASTLRRLNALPASYILRPGEVLLLPDSVPRPGAVSSDFGTTAISTQPLDGTSASQGTSGTASDNPFQNGQTQPLIDPIRHRVQPGETAFSIARLYGVSVTALATWNGLGPDLLVRENQELLIPIASGATRIAQSTTPSQPGQSTIIVPPPSAAQPLPKDIDTAAVATPDKVGLKAQRTPPGGRLSKPVSQNVSRKYNPANPNGVGFAVPVGTDVRAAASGDVALISEELGGNGAIVLIRHKDDLMTTYTTLSDVTVKKGDTVSAGQVIGKVAKRDKPELQFDVFRGTKSVDPTPYISN